MVTWRSGVEYRYTEWVDFNTKVSGGPDWEQVVGIELYDHRADPLENVNVAASADAALLADLRTLLHGREDLNT